VPVFCLVTPSAPVHTGLHGGRRRPRSARPRRRPVRGPAPAPDRDL